MITTVRNPFRLQETTRSSALTVAQEMGPSKMLPTSFLLIHSIGNSSSLWRLFKIFLSMCFTTSQLISDLSSVSFDWQKGFGSHWNLILERIRVLFLWVLQSVWRPKALCQKTCRCLSSQLRPLWQIYNPWAIRDF